MFFIKTNQYGSALKTLKDIEKTGTTDTELYSTLAMVLYCLGNMQEALQYANKSIMFDRTEGDVIAVKGLALYHLGKKEKAIELLKKAEAQKSTSILPDVYETLGRISFNDEDYQTAFRYIEKGLAIDAKNYDLYILKADCYSKMLDTENLIATLLILEKLNNKNPAIYEWFANTYTMLENFEKSLFYINKALKLEPQNQYYLSKKVDLLNTTKNHKEALKILKNIESLAPEDKQVCFDIAKTYYLMQDIEKSIEYLEKYIFFNKDDFYGYKLKGIILFEQKKYQASLKNFLKVKDLGYCDVEIENYIHQIKNNLRLL